MRSRITPSAGPAMSAPPARRRRLSSSSSSAVGGGFTLVELLVVIGIIALLISILLPTLSRAKEAANGAKCSSNLRQLMTAALMFAQDHKGQLPGGESDKERGTNQSDPRKAGTVDQRDWVSGGVKPNGAFPTLDDAPQEGTLFPYVSKNFDVYKCPSREASGTGIGGQGYSNGKFDYCMFKVFNGAKVARVYHTSTLTYIDKTRGKFPTPVFVEEDAKYVNLSNIDASHSNVDPLSRHHKRLRGSYYASIDGSVHYIEPVKERNPPRDQVAWDWFTRAPSGSEISMGEWIPVYWGWFNKQ